VNTVEKILDSIGLRAQELSSLGQTDSLIICRVFEAVQEYAMYRDKKATPAQGHRCRTAAP
jgi:hypothetical protein